MLRALALGARGGATGVAKAIDILRSELDVSMALTGVKRIADISSERP
jgi:isopentenyl diphosphate isomerase/L-lactate dehydrogenase-like FMN-dependent dehydrogenase